MTRGGASLIVLHLIFLQLYREAIPELRDMVIKRLLDVLLDEDQNDQSYAWNAKRLVASFRYIGGNTDGANNEDISIRCLKLSFRFLEEEPGMSRADIRVATMLRLSLFYSPSIKWYFLHRRGPGPEKLFWPGPPDWHAPNQFCLLVNYLTLACEGTDYDAISDAFWVLT